MKDTLIEDHPLPSEHLDYLINVVASYLNIDIKDSTSDWAISWNRRLYETEFITYPIKEWKPKEPEWLLP